MSTDDRDVRRHWLIAALLAVVFSVTPFAFVLCGVNCAHAASAATEAHSCHDTESTAAEASTTIRGVPPRCTHLDSEEDFASRVETIFTMALYVELVPRQIEAFVAPLARSIEAIDDSLGAPVGKPTGLQLRV